MVLVLAQQSGIRLKAFIAPRVTQAQLAREAGVSRQFLCDVANGRRSPTLAIVRAAYGLGLPIAAIFDIDPSEVEEIVNLKLPNYEELREKVEALGFELICASQRGYNLQFEAQLSHNRAAELGLRESGVSVRARDEESFLRRLKVKAAQLAGGRSVASSDPRPGAPQSHGPGVRRQG